MSIKLKLEIMQGCMRLWLLTAPNSLGPHWAGGGRGVPTPSGRMQRRVCCSCCTSVKFNEARCAWRCQHVSCVCCSLLSQPAGAYTSICSSKHVPQYNERADELKQKGVDRIICLSVNGETHEFSSNCSVQEMSCKEEGLPVVPQNGPVVLATQQLIRPLVNAYQWHSDSCFVQYVIR